MSKAIKKFGMAVMMAFALIAVFNSVSYAGPSDSAATPANSLLLNGWWDGTQTGADSPGELTLQIGSIVSGVHPDSNAAHLESLYVDSVFAFSSLESLQVTDSTGIPNYDTVYFEYIIQNYGNVASDSFGVVVRILDTSDAAHFPVTDLDVTDGVTGAANVLSWATSGGAEDSVFYGVNLAEGALDTFFIRVVIPNIDSAADGDNIDIAVDVRDQKGVGTHDYWPDTLGGAYGTAARAITDTFATYLFTDSVDNVANCLLDFGDSQTDIVRITVGGASIRLAKHVTRVGFSGDPKPGDTLTYTIKYDNDGSGATADPAYIVDRLPAGVYLIDTLSVTGGNGSHPTTEVMWRGSWISRIPTTVDSLTQVTAMRFTVPTGLDANVTGAETVGNTIADDSTGVDAGMIKFQVRVR